MDVLLQGDFEASFTKSDNSNILPTDTIKNTVYSLARDSRAATIEEFAMELGDYLLQNNRPVTSATVEISERGWKPIMVEDRADPYAFKLGGPELQTVHATRTKEGAWLVTSGIDGLTILKTTKSGFEGFVVDNLTTLKPVGDRILGTSATAKWQYGVPEPQFAAVRECVFFVLLKAFAVHSSKSVQHTLFDMGKAVLAATPEITRITLTMPNLHHLLADLRSFGQENPNHIFVPIDEPHGYIEATVER